jgi:hypothetical protein
MGFHIHIKTPGFVRAIGKAVASAGKIVGEGIEKIDKIPGFSVALTALSFAVPGAGEAVAAFDAVNAAVKIGGMVKKKSKVVAAAAGAVPPQAQQGFNAAIGMLSQPGITPAQFAAMRNAMPSQADKDSFDMAVALQVGGTQGPAPPPGLSPADQAGWYVTHGAVHGLPGTGANTVSNLAGTPLAGGAAQAAVAIKAKRSTWWHKFLVKLHILEEPATADAGTVASSSAGGQTQVPAADPNAAAAPPASPAPAATPPAPTAGT